MAAVALVSALTVLTAPGAAYASPARPAPPSTSDRSRDLEQVRAELDGLYHDAAVATEAYNAAEEKAEKQSGQIVQLAKDIVAGQKKLDRLKSRAGAAARQQYRDGGMPPEAQLMLSDDPSRFLDGADRMRQGQHATKGLLGEMARTQEDLQTYAQDATRNWKKLEAGRKEKARAQKKIKSKIAAAEKLESQLEKKERERLKELEQQAEYKQQTAWLSSGVLKDIKGSASARGKKAVAFATGQLGKPYVWGAEGPAPTTARA
jgi:septal ring factor EnvC (AmiA/AmiB activator)